jgi:hypothetical protein
MPIVQDRMIKVVSHADALLSMYDNMREFVKTIDFNEINSAANSMIDKVEDQRTKDGIAQVLSAFNTIYYLFKEFEVPPEVRNNIIEERTHFKANRKSNFYLANYQRYKRHAEKQMAESVAQIPQFFSVASNKPNDDEVEMTKPAPPPKLTQAQKDYLDGRTSSLAATPSKQQEKTKSQERLKTDEAAPAKLTGRAYADPDVVSTSVPSDEELYGKPVASDKDLL